VVAGWLTARGRVRTTEVGDTSSQTRGKIESITSECRPRSRGDGGGGGVVLKKKKKNVDGCECRGRKEKDRG